MLTPAHKLVAFSRMCPTCSAVDARCRTRVPPRWRMAVGAKLSCSMVAKRCRVCRSMLLRSTAISTSFRRTSCTDPTGIGALWARAETSRCHAAMAGRGFDDRPRDLRRKQLMLRRRQRFEAGTPAIVEVIAFAAAAIDYVEGASGSTAIHAHEAALLRALRAASLAATNADHGCSGRKTFCRHRQFCARRGASARPRHYIG